MLLVTQIPLNSMLNLLDTANEHPAYPEAFVQEGREGAPGRISPRMPLQQWEVSGEGEGHAAGMRKVTACHL